MTSHLVQHIRRLALESFQSSASAVLLACVGIALAVGVVASSALAPAPSFAAPQSYATGFWPSGLAIADVNGDDRADLATANYGEGANSVSVLLNGAGGRFRDGREYVVGESPGSVAIGELNGDRKPDLAVANEETNSVSVLLNSGDGTFGGRRDYPTGEAPASVAIGDLNGDGSRDLATANFVVPDANITGVPGTVSVLLNSGDGGFLPKVDYRTGQRPLQVVIGDLTGDGQPDLATGNRSDTVSVLANKGNGTFASPVDSRAGSGPRAIAIADLNTRRQTRPRDGEHELQHKHRLCAHQRRARNLTPEAGLSGRERPICDRDRRRERRRKAGPSCGGEQRKRRLSVRQQGRWPFPG